MAATGTGQERADGRVNTLRATVALPSFLAVALVASLTACSQSDAPRPVNPSRSTHSSAGARTARTASAQRRSAVADLGRAAGCAKVTTFAPTKPASQGAFCTFTDGITLNLLVFRNATDRDTVLKVNYAKTHVDGYGRNWTVLGLYDDLRPTSARNKTVAADVTRATKRAGGTVLK